MPSKTPGTSKTRFKAQQLAQQEAAAAARRRNRWLTASLGGVLVLVVGVVVALQARSSADPAAAQPAPGASAAVGATVRDNSHRLSEAPDGSVAFVEFLDFECEACGAAFPVIEQMRATYGDRISFVARYFPLDGHFNARRAAQAVEAAAQQGQFEQMYKKMYQTQSEWAEQQVPTDDTFRRFAQELGLDMAKWDVDYASEATAARIQQDVDDGIALGVEGTPTFFLDGERLEPKSLADLTNALESKLGGS